MSTDVVTRLTSLRQYQGDGQRAPHKPLLVLLALGQLKATGSSILQWSEVEDRLGSLLAEFGPPKNTAGNSPAYPFTRLRTDNVWILSRDVPNDNVGPLRAAPIDGRFAADVEAGLRDNPDAVNTIARLLVESQFPATLAADVLIATGFDPDTVFGAPTVGTDRTARRRDPSWRHAIVAAWDRSCAFCGFDGSLGGAPVGIEAAHVRWFNIGGPDDPDNGLALCSLHHKLFDRGALGLADPETVVVSTKFGAVSEAGKRIYDLHGRRLTPRPGTTLPAVAHVEWHSREVFKGSALSA